MLIDELLTYLFDGQPHLLATPMATWLAASRRYTDFVTTYRDKIRKKLRTMQDQERLYDLQLELETAYLLLQERSLSVVYEPQLGGPLRAPDFAVTFNTSVVFMVEVTRLRMTQDDTRGRIQTQGQASSQQAAPRSPLEERLADAVCSKLGQLQPQRSNILLVGIEASNFIQGDLRAAMLHLQQRAERSDATFVQRYGFRDRADFFQHYLRLSELLVRGPRLEAGEPVIGWVNPQAKYPLPSRVRTALYRSQKGD